MNNIKNNKCYVCDSKIMSEEDLVVCENCNNIYHKICWQEIKEKCAYCYNKNKKEEINNDKS